MSDAITIDDLENAIDSEIRNINRGMTLGFIRSVDADAGTVRTADRGAGGMTTRRAENVLTMLNGGGSWEIYDGGATNTL